MINPIDCSSNKIRLKKNNLEKKSGEWENYHLEQGIITGLSSEKYGSFKIAIADFKMLRIATSFTGVKFLLCLLQKPGGL